VRASATLIYGVGGDAAHVVHKITSHRRRRIAGQIETRAVGMRRAESQHGLSLNNSGRLQLTDLA
jgi:hypothetical protein